MSFFLRAGSSSISPVGASSIGGAELGFGFCFALAFGVGLGPVLVRAAKDLRLAVEILGFPMVSFGLKICRRSGVAPRMRRRRPYIN